MESLTAARDGSRLRGHTIWPDVWDGGREGDMRLERWTADAAMMICRRRGFSLVRGMRRRKGLRLGRS